MLKMLDRLYGHLLLGLMGIAALYIGAIMFTILYITAFRTFGWPYSPFSLVFIEYGFIYILFLGSPWLIRNRGHVYIELLTAAISERSRKVLSRAIAATCALICLVWAYYSLRLVLEDMDFDRYDELRAQLDIKRWWLTVAFPIGFLLMAGEFVRYVFVREPMHTGLAGVASERAELEQAKADLQRKGR